MNMRQDTGFSHMDVNRRGFLCLTGTIYLSAGLPFPAAMAVADAGSVEFPQGVASSDPTQDAIMLWTRAVPLGTPPYASPAGADIALTLQLSTSPQFSELLLEERVIASREQDFTVHALVDGLEPERHYYYRFIAPEGGVSRIGRTITAPLPDSDHPVNLAFACCQNYEQGFYGAWARMVHEDEQKPLSQQIQFVLHLGDFIYERYRNGPSQGQTFVRTLPALPDGADDGERVWADSLADYRHLYKTYLADPHLQAARARWPFICTWDDHEFSNDSWQHFSTYAVQPRPELGRRRDAHRAWFEYMAPRVPARRDLRMYRKLRWGRHVDLLMTDLRSYRSKAPVPPALRKELGLPLDPVALIDILDAGRSYRGDSAPDMLPFGNGDIPNPARQREPGTMLGAEQKGWFKHELARSGATWKVWANSLPILPMRLDLATLPLLEMADSILSEDAWAGYPGEYRELMRWLQSEAIAGVVSLSGDHHMHGAATLVADPNDTDPVALAVDFNVSGISSSPHFRNVLYRASRDNAELRQLVTSELDGEPVETWNMSLQDGVLAAIAFDQSGFRELSRRLGPNSANPGLAYIDTNCNGYGLASFDHRHCQVELVTIEPPLQQSGSEGSAVSRRARFHLPRWDGDGSPQLDGPQFVGKPPFPY